MISPLSICRRCSTRPADSADYRYDGRHICRACSQQLRQGYRLRKWNDGYRPTCRNHPDRVVSRSSWIHSGIYLCASCLDRKPCKLIYRAARETIKKRTQRLRRRLEAKHI